MQYKIQNGAVAFGADIILKNIIRNILLSNVYITQDNDIRIILP